MIFSWLDRDREIDDIENLQGIGFLMAGTEDIANDDVEGKQCIGLDKYIYDYIVVLV